MRKQLKILKLPEKLDFSPSRYRGLDRIQPYHLKSLPEGHEANQLFLQFLEASDERGVLGDDELALRIVDAYARLDPPELFEVVQVIQASELDLAEQLLGIDVAHGVSRSLILQGPLTADVQRFEASHEVIIARMAPLIRLSQDYFVERLNDNFLFEDKTVASLYLATSLALQYFRPGLWEGEDAIFEPIGVAKFQGR